MSNNLNHQILVLLGKLALAQGLALNARMELETLVDNYNLKRTDYDDNTVTKINRATEDLEHSENSIGDVIYDITSIEFFKESITQDK